jgi:hypothetical protein
VTEVGDVAEFYDDLAAGYHRLYPDWQAAIDQQGRALHQALVQAQGPWPQ